MGKVHRIHLGSGIYHWPGMDNVDAIGNPNVKADVRELEMYEDGSIDEVYAIHVFEHLPRLEVDGVLTEWCRILKPGGKLVMEMPSMDKIADLIHNGERNVRLTLLGIFGDPRDKGPLMRHEWCWQRWELQELLERMGFDVEFVEPIYHIAARDLRVIGVKNERTGTTTATGPGNSG